MQPVLEHYNFDSSPSFPTFLLNGAEATAAPLRSRQPERTLRDGRALCFQTGAAELSCARFYSPPLFSMSHVHGHDCRFMEIIESICMGNPGGHFLQRLLFEFLCIKTTFWTTRRHLLSNFGSAPKCLFKERKKKGVHPGRAKQGFRVERLSLRV